ncbi:MAG TPA: hypothetical protein VGO48_17010 [Conexibacter sp.]|jgi:hypothetical protein|nr:hypothetical protein [Conexibacter sp.]
MTSHTRIHRAAALAAVALLVLAFLAPAAARADQAYDKVASAYATAGGHLDPCAFTEAELKAAVRGIPPAIRNVVPALRAAMVEGIAAHERGDCRGAHPEEGTTGGARVGGAGSTTPTTTTPPVTTPPVTTQTAPVVPAATTPTTPTTTAPAPAQTTTQSAASGTQERDRTPLVVALIAAGVLVLLALLLWGWGRMRGWDPGWIARVRHAWGEAGFRTTSTWSEFTDWLRLGR